MAPRKDDPALDRDISSRPSTQRGSHSRMRRAARAAGAPSSIPPAPHPRASELVGLDWWLDAHMNLASNVLCLEQSVETSGARSMLDVGRFLGPLGDLRDALYELYCDASDRRMRPLVETQGPLGAYVCALYAACDGILDGLMAVASEIHRGSPDLSDAMADVLAQCKVFATTSSALLGQASEALAGVPVDATNPVDPLRGACQDLRDTIRAAEALVDASLHGSSC
jgi:hypothetical protein